jgi:DNA-binding XRE family transcriptional regulator
MWRYKSSLSSPPFDATMKDDKKASSSMELRRKAGISRMQVANVLGVTQSTVAKWEQGAYEPHLPMRKIKVWADLYACTVDELIEAFSPADDSNSTNQPENLEGVSRLSTVN